MPSTVLDVREREGGLGCACAGAYTLSAVSVALLGHTSAPQIRCGLLPHVRGKGTPEISGRMGLGEALCGPLFLMCGFHLLKVHQFSGCMRRMYSQMERKMFFSALFSL